MKMSRRRKTSKRSSRKRSSSKRSPISKKRSSSKRSPLSSGGKKAYTLYKSSGAKKYDVYVPKNGRLKKVSFGAKGYSDYTIHKDKARRERYRSRHRNDKINDPYSSGFWAYHVLWGETPSLKGSFNSAVRKARSKAK